MANEKTNEVKEIKEEQAVVEGYKHPEKENKDIYSHLTESDLNANYEPQEEAETTETNSGDKAEETEEVATKSVSEETAEEEVVEEDSSKKWDINGTTYSEDDMRTRMVKDYENLVSFSGKQSEKIGGYKQQISELEEKMLSGNTTEAKTTEQETDAVSPEDKDYDIYTKEGILTMARDITKQEIDKVKSQAIEEQKQSQMASASDSARIDFLSRHPEYTEDKAIVDLIQFGASKGIALGDASNKDSIENYLENIHGLKTGDYGFFTNEDSSGTKESSAKKAKAKTINMVNEAKKIKPTLGSVNSTQQEADYDNLSDEQWAKLPEEKRNELLGL